MQVELTVERYFSPEYETSCSAKLTLKLPCHSADNPRLIKRLRSPSDLALGYALGPYWGESEGEFRTISIMLPSVETPAELELIITAAVMELTNTLKLVKARNDATQAALKPSETLTIEI